MRSEPGGGSIVRATTMTPPPNNNDSTIDKWLWDPRPEPQAVNVTIYHIPCSPLEVFMREVVWPKYPGGIAQAIMDLMRKAVQEQRERNRNHV